MTQTEGDYRFGEPQLFPPTEIAHEESEQTAQPARVVLREIIETLLLTLFIFWIVNTATGRFRIEGQSMLPNLHEGEYVLINKLSYYLDEPERGDIVVLHYPRDPSRDFIKRVIGLPGDHIEVRDGAVHVNDVPLNEPYIKSPTSGSGSWVVPEDHYFVMGDNRNNSSDSRSGWYLPQAEIVGKAWVIYWRPEDWRVAPHFLHPEVSAAVH